jgi:hypothetical protein
MTGYPPYPYPPPYPMPYGVQNNGNGHHPSHGQLIEDMRERLATMEADVSHLKEGQTATTKRIEDGEAQKGRLAHRVADLEQSRVALLSFVESLKSIPERMIKLESFRETLGKVVSWGMTTAIVLTALSGKLSIKGAQQLLEVIGVMPPGIGR